MKIAVIGASGFTGSYLASEYAREGNSVIKGSHAPQAGYETLDLRGDLESRLHELAPDFICIPAAISNMDLCEKEPAQTAQTNVEGIRKAASYCKNAGAGLCFFSSDTVFRGNAGPYAETATPDPQSEYGRQKLAAEEITATVPWHLIIRTSSIYGWDQRGKSFMARLVSELSAGRPYSAPVDQRYTSTYVVDLARATALLTQKKTIGIVHVAGPDMVSRYDLARTAARKLGLDETKIVPVKTSELGQVAPRPSNGGLTCSRLAKETGYAMRGIDAGLEDMAANRPK